MRVTVPSSNTYTRLPSVSGVLLSETFLDPSRKFVVEVLDSLTNLPDESVSFEVTMVVVEPSRFVTVSVFVSITFSVTGSGSGAGVTVSVPRSSLETL